MKPDNKQVRLATYEDIPELVELTKDIPNVYGLDEISPYNEEKTFNKYTKSIENSLCFISEKDNKIISVMVLSAKSTWWSEKLFLTNDIIYAKDGEFTYSLLKEYRDILLYIANKNNLPVVFDMIAYKHDNKSDIDKKERMFLKLFKNSEKFGTMIRIS